MKRLFAKSNFLHSFTYTTRVTVAFALVAAMTALVAIGVVSFVWERYFQTYTADNMYTLAETTAKRIEAIYAENHDLYSVETMAPAEQATEVTGGVAVRVLDARGNVIYDSTDVIQAQIDERLRISFEPKNASQVAMANIVNNDQVIGSVRVWVYGSDTLMRQPDQVFRQNSYQAMIMAAVVAIVLASCIGYLFARSLVAPIKRMTTTAQAVKEGDLNARTGLTGEDEIARLGETFDAMTEAVEKDRELERRLTTDVAHELRTPLMAIQATVEAMIDGVYEADEERLDTVNSEVRRLSRLVDALLKLSRLENRSNPMRQELLDVGELISSIIDTHEMLITESGLTLNYHAEPGVMVVGDPDMIRQATANLISNAVRYTPEGGSITVSVSREDGMAAIEVKDTGIGLTPEEARMVFSRFWRAGGDRNRESGGLGIGLSVVKEIVDRHKGRVAVEGEKDVGATFTIYLPLANQAQQGRSKSWFSSAS